MIGLLVAISFAVWFFITAKKIGKNPWPWAVAGLFSYYVPVFIWGLVLGQIIPALGIQISSGGGAIAFGLAIGLSAVAIGATCAAIVRSKILLQNDPEADTRADHRSETNADSSEPGSNQQ